MGTAPGQPISAAVRWTQEWQRLSWASINQAMGHYLHGCADLAMTRTPQLALAALHQTHSGLLRHSTGAMAEAISLWQRQKTELLVLQAARARSPETDRQVANQSIR